MAEAIARALAGERVGVQSAGITPLGRIADQTIATLDILGYPSGDLSSKGFGELEGDEFDVVVSLLGEWGLDHIPQSFGSRREAWAIPDPYGEDDEVYFEVARQLDRRIRQLLSDELDLELFTP